MDSCASALPIFVRSLELQLDGFRVLAVPLRLTICLALPRLLVAEHFELLKSFIERHAEFLTR